MRQCYCGGQAAPRAIWEGVMIRVSARKATPLYGRSVSRSSPKARCDAPGVPGTGVTLPLMKVTPWSPALLPPPQCQVSDTTKQRFTSSEFRVTNPENEAGEGKVRLRVPVLAVLAPDGGVGVPDSTGLTAASCSCPLPQALGAWSASALR